MRVKIKPGSQQQFLETIRQVLHWSWVDLANHCGVALRTFSNWYEEHYNAPYEVFQSLSNLAGVPLPEFEEIMTEHEWRSRRSRAAYRSRAGAGRGLGTAEGRSKGGRIAQKRRHEQPELYPDFDPYHKRIIRPSKSPELAEFIGIMLGDGGIAEYQATITSNLHEEEDYAHFIAQQALELFGIGSRLQKRPDHGACSVVLSSRELVLHLQELGLVQGNKVEQQCAIPDWIFKDLELMRGCVRGLMDTDGCVYHHGYAINGKRYNYVKMTFASRSWPLMEGIQRIWRELGLTPGAVRKRGYISLSSDKEVRRYYEELVGTHNPYHWRRYCAAVEATRKEKRE
jgi:hypothetical protein